MIMGNSKDTYVYMIVDTVKINQSNKDTMVEFSDNRNDPPSSFKDNPAKFVSKVDKGKKIIWRGNVKDPDNLGHFVDIKQIPIKEKVPNSQILKDPIYTDNIKKGIVVGKVKDNDVNAGEIELYNITFQVNDKNSYTIDPQMRMI